MRRAILTTLALAIAGFAGNAGAQTVVSANVTTNTTWSGTVVLANPIFLTNGATLTILPGTIVRGQPRTALPAAGVTAGTPGTLIVTRDGRLVANGTASAPIIFTTAAIDNNNDGLPDDVDAPIGFPDTWVAGDVFLDDTPTTAPLAPLNPAGLSNVSLWGGVVILGNAPTNNADKVGEGYGVALVEGLTVPGFPAANASYGGLLPHDNSGLLNFVSIRHAGDEIGNSNELNGLTLGGVGDGTVIQNIEVYCNFDDGIEWFGGTVNGKNLAVFFAGDDSFDVDEGYTGVNQYLFTVMAFFNENDTTPFGSASSDKGGEFDGDNYRPDNAALNDNVTVRINIDQSVVDPTPWPLSNSNWYNMTVIGSTPDAGQDFTPVSPASTNRGIQFRNGFAGNVFNSIVVNTGAETGIEVDTGVLGAPGFNAIDNANNGLIALVCSTLDDGAGLAAQETTVVNNGNALNLSLGGNAGGANVVNGAFNGLVNEDQTFNPVGNAAGKLVAGLKPARLDPRPAAGLTGVVGCVAPRGAGLDPTGTFRGAFSRTAPVLWTTGWTAMNIADLLAD